MLSCFVCGWWCIFSSNRRSSHVFGIVGSVGLSVAGRRVHMWPVIVAPSVHVVCVVLLRELIVGDLGDGIVEIVVRINGCLRQKRSGRAHGCNLLLQRAGSGRWQQLRGWTRRERVLREQGGLRLDAGRVRLPMLLLQGWEEGAAHVVDTVLVVMGAGAAVEWSSLWCSCCCR